MPLGLLLALMAGLMPALANADWLEASSPHFVIYADESESDLRTFSEQLERFHSAVAYVTGAKVPVPSPSNRVTVFVVDTRGQVRNLYGDDNKYVAGFYRPAAGNTRAVVSRISKSSGDLDFSMIVLLHEYAHHFMRTASTAPMPLWYSEGAAEFFASAGFGRDGSVELGRAAQHRAGELMYAADVTATDLLDTDAYAEKRKKRGNRYDAFYGKSWLLFHYLTFSKERSGQLSRYTQLLGKGSSSRDAAVQAFGDLDVLEKELDGYVRSRKFLMIRLGPEMLDKGSVRIRRLTPGEDEMMPVQIRSRAGVSRDEALKLLPEARKVAGRFPGDAAVLAALAEAEHDAGNDAEAIAAADAAIARDPAQVNAYIQKGLSMFRLASRDPDPVTAYARARAPFLALNRIENDHPVPLIHYYFSFVRAGQPATANALDGLERAVELAPFDASLRMTLATEQIERGNFQQARRNLGPVAYDPHGGKLAEAAQRVLNRIDDPEPWDGSDLASVIGADAEAE